MVCPACGVASAEGSRFCGDCGAALVLVCPQCGVQNPPDKRFCRDCGSALDPAQPPASATTPITEPPAVPSVPSSFCDGRYEVKKFLGEGGKKRVFLAHDALLDRDVAFALIKTEGLDEVGRERIRREAQAMGRLGRTPMWFPSLILARPTVSRSSSPNLWAAGMSRG